MTSSNNHTTRTHGYNNNTIHTVRITYTHICIIYIHIFTFIVGYIKSGQNKAIFDVKIFIFFTVSQGGDGRLEGTL